MRLRKTRSEGVERPVWGEKGLKKEGFFAMGEFRV